MANGTVILQLSRCLASTLGIQLYNWDKTKLMSDRDNLLRD